VTVAPPTFKAPYSSGALGALRGVLVVPPSPALGGVSPTHGEAHAIADRAAEQFGIFLGRLAAHGVKAVTVAPPPDAPLAPMCVDCAVIFEDGAFLMRPSDLARRREVALVEAALGAAQVPIVGRVVAPGLLDGGDVLRAGDTLYVGVAVARQAEIGIPPGVHGNALGREQLAAYARSQNLKVVEVPMAAEVRRLSSVATFLDAGTVVVASGLVDQQAFAGAQKIEAPRGEDYGAGVLTLGNRGVLANLRFRETIPLLRKAKFAVDAIDLWEFGKLGITPSSLALSIKRD
jgi:dimethylargininase